MTATTRSRMKAGPTYRNSEGCRAETVRDAMPRTSFTNARRSWSYGQSIKLWRRNRPAGHTSCYRAHEPRQISSSAEGQKLVRCHPNLTRRASRSRLRFLWNDRESERGTTAASSTRIGHWSFALEILIRRESGHGRSKELGTMGSTATTCSNSLALDRHTWRPPIANIQLRRD